VIRAEFHPEALVEYEEAVKHDESKQPNLGHRFIVSVQAALLSIVESPARWPTLELDVRRRLTRVFPYAVLYSVESDYVLILAVMHCHQKPGYWRKRYVA
jgi:toxin ParE1/3/4